MAQRVLSPSESWHRIDAWLAVHAASDPALLSPPAAREEIREAERVLGIPLPGGLAESPRCHNGVSAWATVLPEHSPLAVTGGVEHWKTRMDVAAENDGLPPRPWDEEPWWHPLWVPWAEGADGAAQVIDLRRPGTGRRAVRVPVLRVAGPGNYRLGHGRPLLPLAGSRHNGCGAPRRGGEAPPFRRPGATARAGASRTCGGRNPRGRGRRIPRRHTGRPTPHGAQRERHRITAMM